MIIPYVANGSSLFYTIDYNSESIKMFLFLKSLHEISYSDHTPVHTS